MKALLRGRPGVVIMDRFVSVECPFCGERTRKHDLSEDSLAWLNGLYLTHLIESHWELLKDLRAKRMMLSTTPESFTAWQRI